MAEQSSFMLKSDPDGFGFIYGELQHGDAFYRVDIMPPQTHWRGDVKLEGYEPHPSDWVLYLDGEEIGRVSQRDDIAKVVKQKLLAASA